MRRATVVLAVSLLGCARASSFSLASSTGGGPAAMHPAFPPATDLGAIDADYVELAISPTGQAAIALFDDVHMPLLQLFDGQAWGAPTHPVCCDDGGWKPLYVDPLGRFLVASVAEGVETFYVGDVGASTFRTLKTTAQWGDMSFFPIYLALPDGRVRFSEPSASLSLPLYETDAALQSAKQIGDVGTFAVTQSTAGYIETMGASPNGSMALGWTWYGDMGTPFSTLAFFDGASFDPATNAPDLEPVSFTVQDDGHALAIWQNGPALSISVRDPASHAWGTPKQLFVRAMASYPGPRDFGYAPAWVNGDGSFTVVVIDVSSVQRFTIGADGSIGAPTMVATIGPAPSPPIPLIVAERNGARLVTWMSFENGSAIARGVFVDAGGTWSDPFDIGAVPGVTFAAQDAALAANGDAVVLVVSRNATSCEHPLYRHFTKAFGWGDIEPPLGDSCVVAATVGITDDGTVSTLCEVGPESGPVHVFHAIAAH